MRPVGSKYLLEEPLGRGASGTVWRARPAQDDVTADGAPSRIVAIKVLREELAGDPDVVLRFLQEHSALRRLTHANIVRTRDLVVEGDLLALVMDFIDGPDLHRYLREEGPLDPLSAVRLTAQIADALAASHADGVLHRDLKPANIMLAGTDADDDAEIRPMLTDFGIARLADAPGLTRTHEFVGTPAYLAPETALGHQPSSAVDVYSAGILLYELIAGKAPFAGGSALEVLHRHQIEEPQRPAGFPAPVWTVVEHCLRKEPLERPSAESLAQALRAITDEADEPALLRESTADPAAFLPPDPQPTLLRVAAAPTQPAQLLHTDPVAAPVPQSGERTPTQIGGTRESAVAGSAAASDGDGMAAVRAEGTAVRGDGRPQAYGEEAFPAAGPPAHCPHCGAAQVAPGAADPRTPPAPSGKAGRPRRIFLKTLLTLAVLVFLGGMAVWKIPPLHDWVTHGGSLRHQIGHWFMSLKHGAGSLGGR
ncbi:protein kinase [Streptomyces sp. NPDC093589]|uniref:serine/threonine-protein kinase n=1 Tax=Streptomyces sp. NPDC093589 TaxID=3366043 RepID=UPI00381ADE1C